MKNVHPFHFKTFPFLEGLFRRIFPHSPHIFLMAPFFEGCVGVIADKKIGIEHVVIKAYDYARKYLATLPIHPSQKEIAPFRSPFLHLWPCQTLLDLPLLGTFILRI